MQWDVVEGFHPAVTDSFRSPARRCRNQPQVSEEEGSLSVVQTANFYELQKFVQLFEACVSYCNKLRPLLTQIQD